MCNKMWLLSLNGHILEAGGKNCQKFSKHLFMKLNGVSEKESEQQASSFINVASIAIVQQANIV